MIKIYKKDIVSNAIIEIGNRSERRYVTGREINNYGREVISNLKSRNIRAKLEVSKDLINQFENLYSDYFSICGDGYKLKDDKNIDDVIDKFRRNVAYDVLLAFVDDKVVDKSFNLYNPKQKRKTFYKNENY